MNLILQIIITYQLLKFKLLKHFILIFSKQMLILDIQYCQSVSPSIEIQKNSKKSLLRMSSNQEYLLNSVKNCTMKIRHLYCMKILANPQYQNVMMYRFSSQEKTGLNFNFLTHYSSFKRGATFGTPCIYSVCY